MPERWNYKLYFKGDGSAEAKETKKQFEKKSDYEVYDVKDLAKNKFEKTAISNALKSANSFLAELSMPPAKIKDDQIHIISLEEYKEKFPGTQSASFSYDNIYVPRQGDKVYFVEHLTHELSHLISHLALRVEAGTEGVEDKTQSIIKKMQARKMGYSFRRPWGEERNFNGLNEAATEFLAEQIRLIYIETDKNLNEDEKKELFRGGHSYTPQQLILSRIVNELADGDPEQIKTLRRQILEDVIAGKYTFLKKLSTANKEAVKILFNMDATNEGAYEAAKELGYEDIAEEIYNNFIAEKKDG